MKNLKEQSCKDIFKNAYEKRYTWNTDFKGYKGKCTYLFEEKSYEGEFLLGEDFKPEIKNKEQIREHMRTKDQSVINQFERWWDKYRVSLHEVDAKVRQSEEVMWGYLKELGYE